MPTDAVIQAQEKLAAAQKAAALSIRLHAKQIVEAQQQLTNALRDRGK